MNFYSDSEQREEKVDGEEYIENSGSIGQRAGKEPEEREYNQSRMSRWEKKADEEGEAGTNPSARSRSQAPKSLPKIPKVKMPRLQLVLKVLAVVAVLFNFRFIMNLMKDPIGIFTFYHTVTVLGICAGINFAAVWILFSKRSQIRFYLSLAAILGAFAYYFKVNYTNHSFLGTHLLTSALMILSVLIVINPKASYYVKSIMLLVIPVIGIYISSNQFALVWVLMGSAGLVQLFRVTKLKTKSKPQKREGRSGRGQSQSA